MYFLCCSMHFLCCSIYFFCVVLCDVCFVMFPVLFVCICVLYYCHRVATQLQLNISYHIKSTPCLDDWLTVQHRSITLVDLQLDAYNFYLFTYNTFIKILYMFRALPCSSSGGLRRNCIYAASGIVTLHR
jgi:hypothetical protein